MARAGSAWVPDGRARAIRAGCEASLAALDGLPIDVYLLHAPDPRTPWQTSVRALARLVDDGLVRSAGLSNVSRTQLDEALELLPVAAVQVALSPYDDRALRGGVVERCEQAGIPVMAHSPLGGPRRAGGLARKSPLAEIAAAHGATPGAGRAGLAAEPVAGDRADPGRDRPETARAAAAAAALDLDADERAALDAALGAARPVRARPQRDDGAEVVLVMGIPGAGKTGVGRDYAERGYLRLNRDERGGSLRDVADALERELAAGAERAVLDNTYLTRAARSRPIEVAARHGLPTRCVWLETSLAQAQVNLLERMLERFGSVPGPAELRELARREPGVHTPTTHMRTARELEPPALDEGLAVDRARTVRAQARRAACPASSSPPPRRSTRVGRTWPASSTPPPRTSSSTGTRTASARQLDAAVARVSGRAPTRGSCALPASGRRPICWCRPPLPALPLTFARERGVDLSRSLLVGSGAGPSQARERARRPLPAALRGL